MQSFADEVKTEATAMADAASEHAASSTDVVGDNGANAGDDATGETGATPGTEPAPEVDRTVPLRALEDEREKRQLERQLREGLERRLRELESRISATQQQEQAKDDVDVPYDAIFEDPKSVFEQYSKALERRLGGRSMDASREMARAQFDDYDETIEKLQAMQVPGLEEAIAKSASPAHTAYRMIKKHERDMQARSNSPEMDAIRRQLEEAQRALSEIRGEVQRPPVSLSQARGASAGTAPTVKTIDNVLASAWDRGPLRGR